MSIHWKKSFLSPCRVLLLVWTAWIWPQSESVAEILGTMAEAGFRFDQNEGILTLRGKKSAGISMKIVTTFTALDSPCQNMFIRDDSDDSYTVNCIGTMDSPCWDQRAMDGMKGAIAACLDTMVPPCRDLFTIDRDKAVFVHQFDDRRPVIRGVLRKEYILQESLEDKDYEMRLPMRLTHPECQWRLTGIEITVRNSFSREIDIFLLSTYLSPADRKVISPQLSITRIDGSAFFRWSFLEQEDIAQGKVTPEEQVFPEHIDAQCYNYLGPFRGDAPVDLKRALICASRGQHEEISFPQSVTQRNQTIIFNLYLHPGVVDEKQLRDKGWQLPGHMLPFF